MEAIKQKSKKAIDPSGILGGTLSLTISTLIVKFLGLIYKIPLASLLGDEGMGYFNSAYTVYAFFYLLCTAGVPKAVMILVSEAKEKKGGINEGKIVRTASALFLLLGVVISLLFIVFSAPLALLIGNSRSAFTMLAIAPSIIFVALAGVIRGYLSANMMLLDIAASQIVEGVGKLAFGLAFAELGRRMEVPLNLLSAMTVSGVTIGAGLGLAYLFVCSKIKIKREKAGQSKEKGKDKQIIKRIFSISVPITLSAAVMSITNLIDLGLIMRGLADAGYSEGQASALYGNYTTLAVPMLNLAISIITPISVAHLPTLTRCFVGGDKNVMLESEMSALRLSSIAGAPMMIGMMLYSEEILSLLFPRSETELGGRLLFLLAPAIFFSSMTMIVNTVLEACGRVRAPLISMLIGSSVKIILSYVIIAKTDLGILGAPIGTVASYAVALFSSLLIYGIGMRRSVPVFSCCGTPYFLGFVSVFLSRCAYDLLHSVISERPLLILSIVLAALIYLVLLVIWGLISPEKILKMSKYTKSAR